MILDDKFIDSLNFCNGVASINPNSIGIEYPFYLLFFDFVDDVAKILLAPDLIIISNYKVFKEDLKPEDIQPIIYKCYNTYQNLKAFY
jgi:hypothetical protein